MHRDIRNKTGFFIGTNSRGKRRGMTDLCTKLEKVACTKERLGERLSVLALRLCVSWCRKWRLCWRRSIEGGDDIILHTGRIAVLNNGHWRRRQCFSQLWRFARLGVSAGAIVSFRSVDGIDVVII